MKNQNKNIKGYSKLNNKKEIELEKSHLSPPGDTLAEILQSLNMTIYDASDKSGLTISQLNSLYLGILPITPNIAYKLYKLTGVSDDFWLSRDASYQLEKDRLEKLQKSKNGK